jgi:surface-anchored protein
LSFFSPTREEIIMSPAINLSRIAAVLAGRRRRRAASAGGRLWLEALEDRTVPAVVIDHGHTDIMVAYDSNAGWSLKVHLDEENITYEPSEALFYAGPNTHTHQPNDPRFNFLGAGPGGDVWVMPQTPDPNKIYLGFGLDGVAPGTFDSYLPADSRVQTSDEWIKMSLIDGRGPGQFSMWQTDAAGNPIVWASTFDPASQDNAIYLLPGGDSHVNWGFTATGGYKVSFQASAYLNGVLTSSDVVTYLFGVEGGFGGGGGAAMPQDDGSPLGHAASPALQASGQATTSLFATFTVDFASAALLSSGHAAASPFAPQVTPSPAALLTPIATLDQVFASTGASYQQSTPQQAQVALPQAPHGSDGTLGGDFTVDLTSASLGSLQPPARV